MSSLANQSRTLSDAVLSRRLPGEKSQSWLTDALLIALFSGFVALTAQIEIRLPFTPVPITGQTLGVLLAGAALGSRRGALALVLYLIEGAIGLPVFAGGAAGFARILGPTGGYLLALPLAAGIVGSLAERGWDRRLPLAALAMIIGNLVIYLLGVSWLGLYKGILGNVSMLWAGVYPFLPGDLLKIAIAAVVLPGAWKLLQNIDRRRS
ncbi:MAG: biotin transporter BioY [Chloroflexi bacterium]|nr:biotin transporter BioY [Chloroflexota bacterium]